MISRRKGGTRKRKSYEVCFDLGLLEASISEVCYKNSNKSRNVRVMPETTVVMQTILYNRELIELCVMKVNIQMSSLCYPLSDVKITQGSEKLRI
jgi:hypothetical protein